jgi:SAM-dependent methyltransferase
MSDTKLNESYWTERYKAHQTGWDIGYPNPALMDYATSCIPKNARILIPGAGNAYEAEALWTLGYQHVFPLDISEEPRANFLKRIPAFPEDNYLSGNFFELDMQFDFMLEQTFFCAISPDLRPAYIAKVYDLLLPGGKLAGVLFNFPLEDGPPFGGSEAEYRRLFAQSFTILHLETCRNSIKPRLGREFFFQVKKK